MDRIEGNARETSKSRRWRGSRRAPDLPRRSARADSSV